MVNEAPMIVSKIWGYCNVLRHDGVSYGDYIQQLTNLLFLKMADEQTKPPFNKESIIPKKYDWNSLLERSGSSLESHYRDLLQALGKKSGLLGVIYRKSQNKIQKPANLERLIKLIDEETWLGLDIDVKGEIYEGLLEKNAEDVKGGAGQYFTPRALISAIVDVVQPKPGETIGDPACGTGGFFLKAHDYIDHNNNLDKDQKKFLKTKTFKGQDIVSEVTRLCAMNMYLHGIGAVESQVVNTDSLIQDPGDRFDVVMTNPPFGKKTTLRISNGGKNMERGSGKYERDDFWVTTSNKQLNFLQHVKTILKINGRCAIVVPDNVLFEGGAGTTVRKNLLEQFNVHTLLRLPTGIFYAGGVRSNVLFFDKKLPRMDEEPWTKKLWIYDFRTDQHFMKKEKPLAREDLDDFVKCYNAENISNRKETERFKSYSYEDLMKQDKIRLDIVWSRPSEESDDLPSPEDIAQKIKTDLDVAVNSITELIDRLEKN